MAYLLDVNVLLALIDKAHIHHQSTRIWFENHGRAGWATCPSTERAALRLLITPDYRSGMNWQQALDFLRQLTAQGRYAFLSEEVSLLMPGLFPRAPSVTNKQITHLHLLALCVRHSGSLATFDQRISRAAEQGAEAHHLTVVAQH